MIDLDKPIEVFAGGSVWPVSNFWTGNGYETVHVNYGSDETATDKLSVFCLKTGKILWDDIMWLWDDAVLRNVEEVKPVGPVVTYRRVLIDEETYEYECGRISPKYTLYPADMWEDRDVENYDLLDLTYEDDVLVDVKIVEK